ncbi:MAG TPA: acyltransferase [Hydrogenophaga sp.]|uniref:acyltransferase family protein n=1 Tax=Hydrogenophaga sp. TaxID=1904254 RepID=UPI002C66E98B|nr:acyltransferase [Hydrogenophaga sp.]HMN92009.1 acyltransferase [Hydrogenophaga sp.]HMP08811.1 acyltransferase [Hydrogenophaga sp.]
MGMSTFSTSRTSRNVMHVPSKSIPSLDGIRAVSILIVLFSHVGLGHIVPGGFGVTVFFFLSGYLITTLLVQEFHSKQSIDIGRFYFRRFLRLAPPLLIALTIAYLLVLAGQLGGGVSWQGFLAQIFYFANYYQLFWDPGQSTPDGTNVLWSLAVEEHFYLGYPFVFLALRRHLSSRQIGWVLMVLSLLILAWRYHLATQVGFESTRTYYATDTRIDSILWGCILALMVNPWAGTLNRGKAGILPWTALIIGCLMLLVSFLIRDEVFRETLRYTMQGVALMPLFYFAVRYPDTLLMRPLKWSFIKELGVYSYSIYLIHFVIVHFLQQRSALFQNWLLLFVVTLALSVMFASAVERYVDSRLRRVRARYH